MTKSHAVPILGTFVPNVHGGLNIRNISSSSIFRAIANSVNKYLYRE